MRSIILALPLAFLLAPCLAAQSMEGVSPPQAQAAPSAPAAAVQADGSGHPGVTPPGSLTVLPDGQRPPLEGERRPGDLVSPPRTGPVQEGETSLETPEFTVLGGGTAVPASLRTTFGNSNNNIPFSWVPTRYQQVFRGSELPAALSITGLGLRQASNFNSFPGRVIDLEILVGYTTFDESTVTNTFANNFNSGLPQTVFARKRFRLPNMPPTNPTNPNVFFVRIPFDRAFDYAPLAGRNLLIEVVQRGNDNNNQSFTYPLDYSSTGLTTTRVFNSGDPGGATGTVGRGAGHAMLLLTGQMGHNVVPAAQAHAMGNTNNNIPFSWTPTRYQQVFRGGELPVAFTVDSLALRQTNFGNLTGHTVDVEMFLGYSTFDDTTLTDTFDSNFTSGRMRVLNRKNIALPPMGAANSNPFNFFLKIPLDAPFAYAPSAGRNVLLEIVQRGNSNNNQTFTYPLDAASGSTTTRLFNTTNPGATIGTLGRGFGLVFCLYNRGNARCLTLPEAQALSFGNSDNAIPISWTPVRYQQVFLGSEVPRPIRMTALGIRRDDRTVNVTGHTVDLEIRLARTTKTPATLEANFANNLNAGAALTVVDRRMIRVPDLPATPPHDPQHSFLMIPFDRPFTFDPATGHNVLVEIWQRGNSNNNQPFGYFMDAHLGTTTMRVYGDPTSATGTLNPASRDYGLVMCFVDGQVEAAYTAYGQGCPGSGPECSTVPAAQRAAFGNSNNNIPFSWTPVTYQQVFRGSELPASAVFAGVGLRQTSNFGGRVGHDVRLAIDLGHTRFDESDLTTTFASNFNAGAPTRVFAGSFRLPTMPNDLPTDPSVFFVQIPFSAPFSFNGATGNLLIQIDQTGNSNANQSFSYPLDAHNGTTTTRLWGTGATGTLGRNYGLVMCFLGGRGGVPVLLNEGEPRIGHQFQVKLFHGNRSAPYLHFLGVSRTTWSGIPLPLPLAGLGAPGCSILASGEIILSGTTSPLGMASVTYGIPFDLVLEGGLLYNQYLVVDPINTLGLVTSNGGQARVGTY